MTDSLDTRFKKFISQLPSAEVIDNLVFPSEFDKSKRSDFLIDNRKLVIELKSLESDPEYKVHEELKTHKGRSEYPKFYGKTEVSKILKHLLDGELIQKALFNKISRSIEQSFREAEKQIGATKEALGCSDAYGVLVLLNQDIPILSPELIVQRVSQLLTKTDKDGHLHYNNVTSLWFLVENVSLKTKKAMPYFPSIVIDGPSAVGQPVLASILDDLQRKWATFCGVPFVKADISKVSDSDFISLSDLEKENSPLKLRREIWRKKYRNNPYLRCLSNEAVLAHGTKLLESMVPNLMKDGPKIPFEEKAEFMERWTHFLEEASIRGLDFKKMPKIKPA